MAWAANEMFTGVELQYPSYTGFC